MSEIQDFTMVDVHDRKTLKELYNDSALTLVGVYPNDAAHVLEWVEKYTPLKRRRVYTTCGAYMNMAYGLTGTNRYQRAVYLACVKLSDMENPLALTIPRFQWGGRWFDDVVDNNRRREEAKSVDGEEGEE